MYMKIDDYTKKAIMVMLGFVPAYLFITGVDILLTDHLTVTGDVRATMYIIISLITMVYIYGYSKKKKVR